MTRVLIVDDHAVVRQGVRQIIDAEIPGVEFAEASNTSEALKLFRSSEWDVAILDLNMPGLGGMELIREMKSVHPETKLIVLSMHPEDPYAVRVLRAGAMAYVSKESAATELGQAVRSALQGVRHISAAVADLLVRGVAGDGREIPHELLSSREFEVFRRLAEGATVGQIARDLSLSPKTVSTYRTRILQKMGFESNAEIVKYALMNGLLPETGSIQK